MAIWRGKRSRVYVWWAEREPKDAARLVMLFVTNLLVAIYSGASAAVHAVARGATLTCWRAQSFCAVPVPLMVYADHKCWDPDSVLARTVLLRCGRWRARRRT